MRLAEELAGIGIWDIDVANDTVRGTPQFFKIMGLPATEAPVPMDLLRSLRFLEDREEVNQGYRDAVASGADSYESEYRILRPDGQVRWVFGRGRVVRDANGKPIRYSGADIDVTERKAAEHALAESEERLYLAVESADLGIWDWNVVTNEITYSEKAKQLFGFPPNVPVTFEQVRDATHPDDLPRTSAMARRALDPSLRSTESYEYRIIRPDGEVRWVLAYGRAKFANIEGRDQAYRYIGTIQDISERRQGEEHRRFLIAELQHRVKNTLSVVNAIASQTFRDSGDATAREAFSARLSALRDAHDVLVRENWRSAGLGEVVTAALAPHRSGQGRFTIAGPDLRLSARQVVALTLALNELATNAAKYGALSNASGRVDVGWRLAPAGSGQELRFTWSETGGPQVAPPLHSGFGLRLIRDSLPADFGGRVDVEFPASGLTCTLVAPW